MTTDFNTRERSHGWRNADAHAADAARYLDLLMKVLEVQKKQSIDLLHLKPGMSVIEVGCGIGRDAEALAARVGSTGRVIGIDASQELIAQATNRTAALGLPLRFQVDDAHALSFADNSFDAARVDRVLQHLNDPSQAVREMARVVRSGGRIAVIEPDWEMITVAGVPLPTTRAMVRYKVDVAIAHGTIGREVRHLLIQAGCRDVTVEMGVIAFETLDMAERVMSLQASLKGACDKGWISTADATSWWNRLEALDQSGTFFASMCGIIAGATVG